MRNRNLTMGEMAEFMIQEAQPAEFARKRKRRRRRKGTSRGKMIGGGAAILAGGAGAAYLGGTRSGRGLARKGAYQARGAYASTRNQVIGRKALPMAGQTGRGARGMVDTLVNRSGRSVRRR